MVLRTRTQFDMSRENIARMEVLLKEQHVIKKALTKLDGKAKRSASRQLKHPTRICRELNIDEGYLRRRAYEMQLDPFPGAKVLNTQWYAMYLVTHCGFTLAEASDAMGRKFKPEYIGLLLQNRGWHAYTVWGRTSLKSIDQRFLIINAPLARTFTVRQARYDEIEIQTQGTSPMATEPIIDVVGGDVME